MPVISSDRALEDAAVSEFDKQIKQITKEMLCVHFIKAFHKIDVADNTAVRGGLMRGVPRRGSVESTVSELPSDVAPAASLRP